MKYDLIFHITTKENFDKHKVEGQYKPESLEERGFIRGLTGEHLEATANEMYPDEDSLLILVIDPARLNEEKLKYDSAEDHEEKSLQIHEPLNLSAIIDKLGIKAEQGGAFDINFEAYS